MEMSLYDPLYIDLCPVMPYSKTSSTKVFIACGDSAAEMYHLDQEFRGSAQRTKLTSEVACSDHLNVLVGWLVAKRVPNLRHGSIVGLERYVSNHQPTVYQLRYN